ncbi:MAG: glycosyltransferase [Alphaproteobacteria bacterium]
MKILQVLAGAEHGGAETAFVDMCVAMKDAGQDVEVVTRDNPVRVPRLREAGIKVYTLPFGGKLDFYTAFAIKRIIRKYKPDIVQTWMSRAAKHVRKWKPSLKVPPYYIVSRLGGYYKIKYYQNTNYFVSITPDIKSYLVKECGVDEGKIRQINNFAETEEVSTPVDRADYGVPKGAFLCLGLGRLHSSKAFDSLIEAVASLEGVYLWIAGEGPDRVALQALIDSRGLQDRVTLLGWRSDRAALFDAVDACVFSSRYEPFGTVFVQAWAQKTPLITTDSDGPRQFVRHEDDALMVPIDDIAQMSTAIKRVKDDQVLYDSMVVNGYDRYIREFTKEKSVEAYLAYFHDIIEREK